MSMFNNIEWIKKVHTEICLHSAKQVVTFATQHKPRHWSFLEPAWENTCWNDNGNEPQENEIWSHCRWLTHSSVTLHTHYFQRQSHYRLDLSQEEAISTSKVLSTTRRFSSRPCWKAMYVVFTIEFASGMTPTNWYLLRADRKTRANRSWPPSTWHQLTQKNRKCHKFETTRCYNSLRTARRWFTKLPNKQHLPERWKMNISIWPMNLWWMQAVLLLCAENTESQGILKIQDYKLFLAITSWSGQWSELKYSKSGRTLDIEVQVPSRQPGN